MKLTATPVYLSSNTSATLGHASEIEAHKIGSYPHLDWLRFTLASVVVLSHAGILNRGPIRGALAVVVFLALSGWLIGAILLHTGKSDLPRFSSIDRRASGYPTLAWWPYFMEWQRYGTDSTIIGSNIYFLTQHWYDSGGNRIWFIGRRTGGRRVLAMIRITTL